MRSSYQLVLPAGAVTDLDVVRTSLAEASDLLATGAGAAAAVAAARASALAALPFLPEHDGNWADGVRRELRRAHGRALALEAEGWAAAGHTAAAHDAAARLVELDTLDEGGHQLRIRLLAEAGDGAGAARAYQQCRAVLRAELGVEPSPETASALAAVRAPPGVVGGGGRPAGTRQATKGKPPVPAVATAGARAGRDDGGFGGLGVLVVEDHDFQRRTLVQILGSLGVGWVDSAADGQAALDRLSRPPSPDIIICDIDMPGMDGVELVRHVSARDPGSAIVITSGLDSSVLHAVEALGSGYGLEVLGALAKPLTARRLRDVLSGFSPRRPRSPGNDAAASVTADDVRRVVESATLGALFTPCLDITTGELSAVVATPRWPGAPISLSNLLPVAAQAQLLGPLMDHLLAATCRQLAGAEGFPPGMAVVLALPPPCLTDVALADRWAGIASRHGVDPTRVVVAIEARNHPAGPRVLDALTRVRLKGFGLQLHGFDGDEPAVEFARRLPLTGVALAARLVSGEGAGEEEGEGEESPRRDRVEAALDAAHRLGLPCVAEGCDSEADFAMLLALGCREVQGAFVGAAMPADELRHWVQTWPIGVPEGA